jgi:predicted nucleic acid-binding protein
MIYADSTFLVASKVAEEVFHKLAVAFYERHQDEVWLWSPWHRVEVFNAIRQLTRHPDKRRCLSQAEAKAVIHRLESEVRLSYFTHMEADWRDVLQTANEISLSQSFERPCRAADLLHVAYAKELSAALFVSFDDDQLALARESGLATSRPV